MNVDDVVTMSCTASAVTILSIGVFALPEGYTAFYLSLSRFLALNVICFMVAVSCEAL